MKIRMMLMLANGVKTKQLIQDDPFLEQNLPTKTQLFLTTKDTDFFLVTFNNNHPTKENHSTILMKNSVGMKTDMGKN